MKVLFGSHMTVSKKGQAGGLRTYIMNTKAHLEAMGHRVDLFDPWSVMPPGGYDIFHLFAANLGTWPLGRLAKEAGMTLVVSPMIDKVIAALMVRATSSVIRRLPRVHTHLGAAQDLCDLADVIAVWSGAESDYIRRSFAIDNDRIEIAPYGIDATPYPADPGLFTQEYGTEPFVLSVGNLGGRRKNYRRLIRAAGPLGVPTFLAGPIPDSSYARECVYEAKKYANVHLLGFVEQRLLLSAYAAAETYVQPSITEGVGIAILEAALSGAKVVATSNGAPPYYLGDLADYVNPRSERSIREKLLLSLQKPRTTDLQEHILSNFTWEQTVQKLVRAYEKALA
jgi:glycosyltransferase involved in cell wall biosynthesis